MQKEKRLIDANALTDVIEGIDWYHIDKMGYLVHGANSDENIPLYKAVSIFRAIKEAPTVDAVEVVHAHWEDGCAVDPKTGRIIYKSIDCSHCEEIFKIESHDREYWKKRFKVCPFCGAVMDGERKDGK